jgi:2-C-methyl-D-erythritol 4-phosphate cytidylyltransferase
MKINSVLKFFLRKILIFKNKTMKVYIGEFTEQDLKQGNDKKAIAEAQERDENKRNGIKFIESKHDKKKNVMKVWLTDKF